MKFQDSSFNGLKVTVGTKSVTHARTHAPTLQKQYAFQSWWHNYQSHLFIVLLSVKIPTIIFNFLSKINAMLS